MALADPIAAVLMAGVAAATARPAAALAPLPSLPATRRRQHTRGHALLNLGALALLAGGLRFAAHSPEHFVGWEPVTLNPTGVPLQLPIVRGRSVQPDVLSLEKRPWESHDALDRNTQSPHHARRLSVIAGCHR